MNTATAAPTDDPTRPHVDHEMDHEMEHAARCRLKMGWGQRAVVCAALDSGPGPAAGGFLQLLLGRPAAFARGQEGRRGQGSRVDRRIRHLARVGPGPHAGGSDEVATTLGIRKGDSDSVAVAQPPNMMRPLVLPGSTALDPTRLARIRARFAPARVVEIAQVRDRSPARRTHGVPRAEAG